MSWNYDVGQFILKQHLLKKAVPKNEKTEKPKKAVQNRLFMFIYIMFIFKHYITNAGLLFLFEMLL